MTPKAHPEWKQLANKIEPLVAVTELFTYEVLESLAGIDIRSSRGRSQFERFRRYALEEWGLWFECVTSCGYRITKDDEIPTSSLQRMKRGRRQFAKSLAIAVRAKEDGVPDAVIAARRQLSASLGALLQATEAEAKKIRPLIRETRPELLSSGEQSLKSIQEKTG